jgi:hypothetical protein
MFTGFFENIFVKAYIEYILSEFSILFLFRTNRVALTELFGCHPLNAHVPHLLSSSPSNESLQNFGVIYLKNKIVISISSRENHFYKDIYRHQTGLLELTWIIYHVAVQNNQLKILSKLVYSVIIFADRP